MTIQQRSSSMPIRWSFRRRPPIRANQSRRTWRGTATCTTSGRSGSKTGELRQYTDTLGGNTSAVVLRAGRAEPRIAFVSYYKGEWELHTLDRRDPIAMAATADFGAPGPIIDFQAPLSHTLIAENKRRKGAFEKLFLDGRPPVNVGVTSSGDVFGGSAVTFSDVLGDKQISLYAASISQYRTLAFSFFNAARRFNYSLQGFSQTQFFYGALEGVFYDPAILELDRTATSPSQRERCAAAPPSASGRSIDTGGWSCSAASCSTARSSTIRRCRSISQNYQQQQFGRELFRSGTYIPLGVNFVQETTVFREFGPLAGNTMRLSYEVSPNIGDTLGRQTGDVDARYYLRLGGSRTSRAAREGVQELGRRSRFRLLRRAIRRCAGTSTCSSSARRLDS